MGLAFFFGLVHKEANTLFPSDVICELSAPGHPACSVYSCSTTNKELHGSDEGAGGG